MVVLLEIVVWFGLGSGLDKDYYMLTILADLIKKINGKGEIVQIFLYSKW